MSKNAHVHLLDADGDHCRWPMWQDRCTLIVCGEPGYPWCEKHRAIVFSGRDRREREAWPGLRVVT